MKLVIEEGPVVIDNDVVSNAYYKYFERMDGLISDDESCIDEIVIPKTAKGIRWDFTKTDLSVCLTSGLKVTILGNLEIIASKAFYGFPITEITLPETLKTIGRESFKNCRLLERITIPDSVSFIGEEAFSGCTSLREAKLSNSLISLSKYLFTSCHNLKKVFLPEKLKEIGEAAFEFCFSLTSISFPDSLECIDDRAFSDTKIENLYFPKNVKKIGANAFSDSSIKTIVVDKDNTVFDSRDDSNAIIKTKTNELLYGAKNVFVPESVTSISLSFDYGHYDSIKVDSKNKIFDSRENCNGIIQKSGHKLVASSRKTVVPASVLSVECNFFSLKCSKFVIPEGVKNIEIDFYNSHIGELVLPSTLETCSIGAYHSSFKSIVVDPRNLYYDSRDNCNALIDSKTSTLLLTSETTKIPSSVNSIDQFAFCSDLSKKKTQVIPEGVQKLYNATSESGHWTFILPKSLRFVREFGHGDTFYYSGTYEEWKKNLRWPTFFDTDDPSYRMKGISFFAEKKPKDDVYSYWHYVRGKPKQWKRKKR